MTNDNLQFVDNRPITLQQDDLLGRTAFSERLALAINTKRNRENLAIGHAEGWGSDNQKMP
ncbi:MULTISPECIES: hypothetical protein [unclassified Pseudomonas]|uniref:hypothetical protein n=1 Tax=unclassified Pseudomonas TaxID=196821 RepID=UPI00083877C4|nr:MULTISPECIES: hypothetical protein [unclassified Pseudomonas]QIH08061.1 hypothetical protein ATY02_15800 [Pseudomonas sp. BIOMIG1BAC]